MNCKWIFFQCFFRVCIYMDAILLRNLYILLLKYMHELKTECICKAWGIAQNLPYRRCWVNAQSCFLLDTMYSVLLFCILKPSCSQRLPDPHLLSVRGCCHHNRRHRKHQGQDSSRSGEAVLLPHRISVLQEARQVTEVNAVEHLGLCCLVTAHVWNWAQG